MKPLDITEVARRAGVPASTLRFYEEKGLIASIGRSGLRRLFDARVLERLAFIALGRASGSRFMARGFDVYFLGREVSWGIRRLRLRHCRPKNRAHGHDWQNDGRIPDPKIPSPEAPCLAQRPPRPAQRTASDRGLHEAVGEVG